MLGDPNLLQILQVNIYSYIIDPTNVENINDSWGNCQIFRDVGRSMQESWM
jgi:hypothetical protein